MCESGGLHSLDANNRRKVTRIRLKQTQGLAGGGQRYSYSRRHSYAIIRHSIPPPLFAWVQLLTF
jgi:hypothetical protein